MKPTLARGSKQQRELRIIAQAQYMIEHCTTVRKTAEQFGVSKTTTHNDVSVRLFELNIELYKEVKAILQKNKAERHIRGGIATKIKYAHKD